MAIHDKFADLMDRLVRKHGRPVQIRRQTGTTLRDPANPHLGAEPDVTDVDHVALWVDNAQRDLLVALPGEADQPTTVTRETDFNVLVPAKGLPFELLDDHQIVDGSTVWAIERVKRIEPGVTVIGYRVRAAN